MMAKGSAIQAAARISAKGPRPITPLIERTVERSKGKSVYLSVRMPAAIKAEIEIIRDHLSEIGPEPIPLTTAQILTRAIVKYVTDWRAHVRPPSHLRSVK